MGSDNTMRPLWRIQLLGGLHAEREGHVLNRFRTRRAAALLGYLALFLHRSHPRETLIGLLWPETEPESGRSRFRQELHSLRQQLEPEGVTPGSVLMSDRFGLRLNPELVQTDVRELERAVQRASHSDPTESICLLTPLVSEQHPGELLPGIYDDWVLPERERVDRLLEKSTRLLAEAYAALATGSKSVSPSPSHLDTSAEAIVRLPATFTRFFGRGEEISQIQQMLTAQSSDRLITITGPGGSGKTRLALEAARPVAASFPAGVFFVPLAEITDPVRVPLVLQQTLRLPPADVQASIEEQVIGVLAVRSPTLLVLDNLEQLLTTTKARTTLTDFLMTLLERAPRITLLATSRRRLNLPSERIVVANSLPLPSAEAALSDLSTTPSIALFADRARSVRPDFAVKERNSVAVAELCRQLDGLPLALELAAARAATLSPAQMLTQLTERLGGRLDTFARRDPPREHEQRHRSLRAAMQWSQELLSPSLQRILAHLSLFQGGWSTDIAGEVLEEPEIEAALEELCASSLVRTVEDSEGALRFYLLETQREFAQEQLSDEERQQTMARLVHTYCNRLRTLRAKYGIPTEPFLLRFIQTEYENIRAALAWCRTTNAFLGMQLSVHLSVFWLMRGQYAEGVYWFDSFTGAAEIEDSIAVAGPETKTLYARIQSSTSAFFYMLGRTQEGLQRNERAAALLEGIPKRDEEAEEWLGWAYFNIGIYYYGRQDYISADQWYAKALVCMRRTTEIRNVAAVFYRLSQATYGAGDIPRAEELLQEAFTLFREDDDYWQGHALALRGAFAVEKEDYQAARRYFEDSLLHLKRIPSSPQHADTEMELAILERELGNLERSRQIGEAVLPVFYASGARPRAAFMLGQLALTAIYQSAYDAAEQYAGEAERIFESLNNESGIGSCLLLRGHIILERDGDSEQAIPLIRRGLMALRYTPLKPEQVPYAFRLLAECALRRGNLHSAGVLVGITAAMNQRLSQRVRTLPLLRSHYAKTAARVQEALGDAAAFDRAFAEGYALSPEAAFDYLSS